MTDTTICPICEEGHLSPATHELAIRHGDQNITVRELEHSVCDACGEEPVLTEQIRRNQRKIADAKRCADHLLPGDEIRAVRRQLGLTQQEAAVLFGGGANAFSKYERGDVIQSVAMDRLLRLASLWPFLMVTLRQMAGMQEAPGVGPMNYDQTTPVCVNDTNYRSRTVRGQSVVVQISEWRAA